MFIDGCLIFVGALHYFIFRFCRYQKLALGLIIIAFAMVYVQATRMPQAGTGEYINTLFLGHTTYGIGVATALFWLVTSLCLYVICAFFITLAQRVSTHRIKDNSL